jgi:ankyrin repeat protein
MREAEPGARLADAQRDVARRHGFPSWRALKAHVDARTLEGRVAEAARTGDAALLASLLDAHPDALRLRTGPYRMSLLHLAARGGHLAAVDLLLRRGLHPDILEDGDRTYAMHWAAAGGHLDVVRRLADAGGDVVGRGDDHALEVIGWATCWDGCDDEAHRAVASFLVSRGARHHVFSAVALGLADEVRRIAAAGPAALETPMSRNEGFQRPLHFAVRRNLPEMVSLLLELGADPLARDGDGYPPAAYATAPGVDRRVLEAIRARGGEPDLFTALALGDLAAAGRILDGDPVAAGAGGAGAGTLHLLAKRGDARGVRFLLARGADPNERWAHWDAEVTPLHLAALHGHAEVVRLLLAAGADPRIRDSKHDGDALGWATHAGAAEVVTILTEHRASSG